MRQALRQVASELPHVPEGAATLGMLDIDEGVDEDYMLVSRAGTGSGLAARGIARRPTAWVARHLRRQGAVVCSGIMMGYSGVFAAHILKHWPEIGQRLTTLVATAGAAQLECKIPSSLLNRIPGSVLKPLRWHPPAFPQRVFTVCDSGWSSLKSPHAVTRIRGIHGEPDPLARAAVDSLDEAHIAEFRLPRGRDRRVRRRGRRRRFR